MHRAAMQSKTRGKNFSVLNSLINFLFERYNHAIGEALRNSIEATWPSYIRLKTGLSIDLSRGVIARYGLSNCKIASHAVSGAWHVSVN